MIKATLKDRDHVVGILHSAFEPILEPNSINFVVKQDQHRSKRLRVLMEFLVDDCFDFGEVLLSDQRNACILLKYPNSQKITFRFIKRQLRIAFKCIGLSRVSKILKRQAQVNKNHPKGEDYIHPVIMGATSDVKGFGYGVRLMKQLFAEHPDNVLPVVTETTTAVNLNIYKRFGFELYHQIETEDFPIYFLRLPISQQP